jgi:hypothetical protein
VLVESQLRATVKRPASHQRRVVIARDQDHLAVGPERPPQLPQHRLGDGHRVARAARHQLDRVTQQHQAVDAVDHLQQALEWLRPAQHVTAATVTEVEVGDDQRAHGGRTIERRPNLAARPSSAQR